MLKKILIQVGFVALEIGIKILSDVIFGKKGTKGIQDLIENINNEHMTGQQKYQEVKSFVDNLKTGVPDSLKNLVIEGLVTKATGALSRLKD